MNSSDQLKIKAFYGTAEAVPFQNSAQSEFFSSP